MCMYMYVAFVGCCLATKILKAHISKLSGGGGHGVARVSREGHRVARVSRPTTANKTVT